MSRKEKQPKVKQPKVKQPKVKKPIYKKWWFYVLIILILFIIAGAVGSSSGDKAKEEPAAASSVSQGSDVAETTSVSETTESASSISAVSEPEESASSSEAETETEANTDFIEGHENEIVAVASMALDNYISDYDMSLAPQRWTLAKFDETDTVIGTTDVTYKDATGKYIFVGTLEFNDAGKVSSATPHYIEVNGEVLGDDGYCDEVFGKLNEATAATEQPLSFVLMDGVLGDYGEEVTLNAGTEFEETEIMYHIPAGLYSVKNLNSGGGAQVTVYSGAPAINGEWEEFVADDTCPSPIVVMSGEAKDLEIKEGQFVVLADGDSNLEFTMK